MDERIAMGEFDARSGTQRLRDRHAEELRGLDDEEGAQALAAGERAMARVVDAFPNADLKSRADYIAEQAGQIDQLVNLMYGLLGLAIVIALVSIANSISLAINERTRELGLLRAVGMTRHQLGSTVRWEAAMVATDTPVRAAMWLTVSPRCTV